MKISIIIPFYNEEENIVALVNQLSNYFTKENRFDVEIMFVNDGSTDNSKKLLLEQNFESFEGKVISFSKNFGSHAALRAGVLNATGDYITFMYADLQDPLELISQLFDKINEEKKEIIWASRNETSNGYFETTFSKIYSNLMKKYVSSSYPDKGFDIMMFTAKVARVLNQNIESNSSIFLQILTIGFSQGFITYDKKPREKGVSKWTFNKKLKLFIDSFIAFSYAPIRLVTIIGIFLFFTGLIFTVYLFFRKMIYNDLVSGWTMLISILTIGFGVTNISLGIIAEYLWRTFDASRNRPVFVIDEVVELNL